MKGAPVDGSEPVIYLSIELALELLYGTILAFINVHNHVARVTACHTMLNVLEKSLSDGDVTAMLPLLALNPFPCFSVPM